MIAQQIVDEVRRLLAERKLSHRAIAQLTGISRNSVGAIASGKRPDYEPPEESEEEEEEPTGRFVRCPGCGGMVYMPCRLCRVRKSRAKYRRSPPHGRTVEIERPLNLELRPDHRARFKDVCARPRAPDDTESDVNEPHGAFSGHRFGGLRNRVTTGRRAVGR